MPRGAEICDRLEPHRKMFRGLPGQDSHRGVAAEFLAIVDAEAKSGTFSFSFPDLFAGEADDEVRGG